MKLNRHLLIGIIFLSASSYSQINKAIKEQSDKNQENKVENNSPKPANAAAYIKDPVHCYHPHTPMSRPPYNNENPEIIYTIPNDESFARSGFSVIDMIADVFQKVRLKAIDNRNISPRLFSTDLSIQQGSATINNWNIVPKARLNNGLYNTEIRTYQSFEKHIKGKDNYGTLDWQLLQLSFINNKTLSFRIGTGIMSELYSSNNFNENTICFDIYPLEKINVNFETRIAYDYKTKIFIRQEINLAIGYKIVEIKKYDWFLSISFTGANYYETVKFNVVSFMIRVNLPFQKNI